MLMPVWRRPMQKAGFTFPLPSMFDVTQPRPGGGMVGGHWER